MSEIPDIRIPAIKIQSVDLPRISVEHVLPPPITLPVGFPLADIPGCVEARLKNYENEALINNDPTGNVTFCPHGQYPSFNAMDYTPEELLYTESEPPQRYQEPETPQPETPQSAQTSEDCPPPDAPEIGTKVPDGKGTKEITGYELVGNRCVTQYSEVSFVEQIVDAIPSVPQVVTTASIAVVATAAAASTPLILRIVKPAVKQIIKRVQKLLGKNKKHLSVRERILAQRDRNRAIMELRRRLAK